MPLHVIVGHVVIIVAPLVALVALVYAAAPRTRRALRWPLVASAVITTALVLWAGDAGSHLLAQAAAADGNALPPEARRHAEGSDALGIAVFVLVIIVAAVVWWPLRPGRKKSGPGGKLAAVLLGIAAVAVLVTTGTVLMQAMQAVWATHSW